MSESSHQSHHVTVWLDHRVFTAKDRRAVLAAPVDAVWRAVCLALEPRSERQVVELGVDRDHGLFECSQCRCLV